jgi:hypothetical protein
MFKKSSRKNLGQKIIIGFIALAVIFVFDFWIFSPKEIIEPQKAELVDLSLDLEEKNSLDKKGEILEPEPELEPELEPEPEPELEPELEPEPELPLMAKINQVPFLVQAPLAVWDELYNEACEEAALIMAKYWQTGEKLDKEIGNKEILNAVAWQKQNWGGHYDLNVEYIKKLGQEYFNLSKIYYTRVQEINDLKRELSKGNLVIVPTAGRRLNNPYYTAPGPAYHALVLIGYQEGKFITHDPGTKRGENYIYEQEVVFGAIHDWPFKLGEGSDLEKDVKAQEVLKGEPMMVVVEK